MSCGARMLRAAGLAAGIVAAAERPAPAQVAGPPPDELEGVGITERLDAALPLQLTFRDESGDTVSLGSYFRANKPVVLNFVYFNCPMLCNLFLDGFTATLGDLEWTPGERFEIVTVSMDPNDTPEAAAARRARYLERLGRPEAAAGWHFLTGPEENVRRLADAIGFHYRYDPETNQYLHSAGLFLATPTGRISRYLYGVVFDPRTLRLSLVEASDGRIGTATDRVLLFCFAYDHTEGRYGPAAARLMRAGGAATLVLLALFLARHWRREARRRSAVAREAKP